MIKEFKNGNLLIDIKEDIKNGYYDSNNFIDDFYNQELTIGDYYFNQINGYMYLVNYRNNLIYDFSDCHKNVLLYLLDLLEENNYKIKLYPLKKRESKQLFKDLENGF